MRGRSPALLLALATLSAPTVGACGSRSTYPAATGDAGQATPAAPSSSPPAATGTSSPPAQEGSEGSGQNAPDASGDAGVAPSASIPAIACPDRPGDVYMTPAGLPAMTMDLRGSIVRCALDTTYTEADVAAKLAAKNVAGVSPTSGTTFYRIAYRTYRDDGVPGVSTAGVYLPTEPSASPLPVVAIGHPTEGLAPSCAPSMNATALDDLALPWASQGYAVIATDYAGLGNEGVQGYADNHDQAHSLLDSARALRALLDPAALDDRVLLVGYSQGGGAALASQGLASSYGAGGQVVAVVVFAAEYFARLDSFTYETMLAEPTALTISTGVSMPVVAAMRDYAFAYNVLGASSAPVTFPQGEQSGIQGAIMSLDETDFGAYLQGVATTVGDIFDADFRSSLLACMQKTGGCSGIGGQFYTWMQNDLVVADPGGPPVLYVQGLSDAIMPPQHEAACNIQELQVAGVPVQVCTDGPAAHTTVVPRNVGFALQWSEQKLAGGALPTCSAAGLPFCQP
jgi:pimeloyl-ACP methyl ester carboxylesterase